MLLRFLHPELMPERIDRTFIARPFVSEQLQAALVTERANVVLLQGSAGAGKSVEAGRLYYSLVQALGGSDLCNLLGATEPSPSAAAASALVDGESLSRVASLFPDGALYLRLASDRTTVFEPRVALGALLQALAVDYEDVPPSLDDRRRLYSELIRDRRILVVLDGVVDAEQLEALLPHQDGCVTLATSRSSLPGIGNLARRVAVPPLTEAEAMSFLGLRLGEAVVESQWEEARRLAHLCGGAPLALALMTGTAATGRYRRSISGLLRDVDFGRFAVEPARAAFEVAYLELDDVQRRLIRLFSFLPLPILEPELVAALASLPPARVALEMSGLSDLNLLQRTIAAEGYLLHDMIGLYCRGWLDRTGSKNERLQAFEGALEYYQGRLEQAVPSNTATEPPTSPDAVLGAWLYTHRHSLSAVLEEAGTVQYQWSRVDSLFRILYSHLNQAGLYEDKLLLTDIAYRSVRYTLLLDELRYLTSLADQYVGLKQLSAAEPRYRTLIQRMDQLQLTKQLPQALESLAAVLLSRGEAVSAGKVYARLAKEVSPAYACTAAHRLGHKLEGQGAYREALDSYRQAAVWLTADEAEKAAKDVYRVTRQLHGSQAAARAIEDAGLTALLLQGWSLPRALGAVAQTLMRAAARVTGRPPHG